MKQHMKEVIAAGGIVINDNFLLIIKRNGIFDLPKGHLERNETIEECAIREVQEECGISGLSVIGKPQVTFHQYELKGKTISKKTYWFPMKVEERQIPIPQTEENIEEAIWIEIKELDKIMKNTHKNLLPIFKNILVYHSV